MNKTIFFLLLFKLIAGTMAVNAQTYQTLNINGFNHDVIANGVGTAASSTTTDVDGVSYCFKSIDWQLTATSTPQTSGFPQSGIINSAATTGLTYQLQNYSSNNAIRLVSTATNITSVVTGTVKAKKLFVLATSGSGASNLECVVTFQDDTTESFLTNPVADWFNGTNPPVAYSGFGRINRNNNGVENSTTNPRLYQITLNIAIANQAKEIKSIKFTRGTTSSGVINIFAVSAEILGTCPSPDAVLINAITTNTATATLTPPALIPSTGYDYEVRTTGAGGSGSDGLVTSGTVSSNSTVADLTGLPASQTLNFYIRSNCGATDQGVWTGPYSFTMLCDDFGAFYENFDNQPVGSTTNPSLPTCWGVIDDGTGYLYTSSASSYSAPRSVYLYNSSQNSGNLMIVSPKTNNLGNGAYRIRFRARSTTTSVQTLKVVTLESQTSATGMQLLQTLNLTDSFQEYIVNIPAGTHDYFGIAHGLGTTYRTIYVDDIRFEAIPSCIVPAGLTVTNVGLNTAVVNWTATTSPNTNGYTYEVRTSGLPGSGTDGLAFTGTTDANTTSVNLSNLTAGTQYWVYVIANCAADDSSYWTDGATFTPNWCQPTYSNGSSNHRITIVNINEISFTDNIPSYTNRDRTGVTVPDLTVGNTYTFNVTTTGYTGMGIAIDFNNDGNFDETNEVLALPDYIANGTQMYTASVTIPMGVYSGTYRMRIWNRVANAGGGEGPDPCGSYNYGTWADYTVNLTGGSVPCDEPVMVEALTIGAMQAELGWETETEATLFDIEYGIAGFVQGTGTLISGVSNPYTITDLEPDTEYEFYVKQICDEYSVSDWSEAGSFTTLCVMPDPVITSSLILCGATMVDQIDVTAETGAIMKWYASATDDDEISEIPLSGTYYVMTENTLGCFSQRVAVDFTLVSTSVPQAESEQYFCNTATVADLVATPAVGLSIRWYESMTATQPLDATHVLSAGNVYYVVQATDTDCESDRIAVTAIITNQPAVLDISQIALCQPTSFSELQNLGNMTGSVVKWYAGLSSATPLSNDTVISNGTYYVSQTINTCESERTAVTFTLYIGLPVPTAVMQTFCGSATVTDLVATGALPGAEYHWYASQDSVLPLDPGAVLSSGTYYVSQTISGCESNKRSVAVLVNPVAAPVMGSYTFCESATIADIPLVVPTGVSYKWYTAETTGTELQQDTVLTTGTYYVERIEWGCISQRAAVPITILDLPDAPTGASNQSFTVNTIGEATLADLIMDQTNVVWYITYEDARTGTNPLPSEIPLLNGQTYYAVIIGTNGCASFPTAVTVDITLSVNDFDMSDLRYYPNPTADILYIQYKEIIDRVIVYSLSGQKVITKQGGTKEIQLDMSALSAGNYLIELHSQNHTQIIKVVRK